MKGNKYRVRGFIAVAGLACLGGCVSTVPSRTTAPAESASRLPAAPLQPVEKSALPSAQQVAATFEGLESILALAGTFASVQGGAVPSYWIHCQCFGGPKPDGPGPGPKQPAERQAIQNAIDVLSLMLKADAESKQVQFVSDAAVTGIGSH